MATGEKQRPLLSLFGTGRIDPARSRIMSRIRAKGTKPEVAFSQALRAAGISFHRHAKSLPGTPDFANRRSRIAIFIDGCFWHGCPKHFRPPRTRTEFWTEKIRRNQAKRKTVLKEYSRDWRVFQFFECQVRDGLTALIARVQRVAAARSKDG